MANLITLARLLLLFLLVLLIYRAPPAWQLVDMPLLVLIIALDGLDGWVARRRGEASVFGSVFDIAADRVVENVLWICLADLDLVPVWVALVFVVRGLLVDSIRCHGAGQGETPFGMVRSSWGRLLVAGRFMRGLYGAVKAVTFGWILMLQPWPRLFPEFWERWSGTLGAVTTFLVLLAVGLCLLRAVPVVAEFVFGELGRRDPAPR